MHDERFWARCTIERVARSAEQCACCHATESLRYSKQGDLLCIDDNACVSRRREQALIEAQLKRESAGDPTKEDTKK